MTPRDLRDAALKRLVHAPAVLGSVELDRVVSVAPVWHPLLQALNATVPVSWHSPGATDISCPGKVTTDQPRTAAVIEMVSCANPAAEVVEALRWMRELIASGRARPEEISICATSTGEWDEHFLVLAADADLPLHLSHGVPALASREGQACGVAWRRSVEWPQSGSPAPALQSYRGPEPCLATLAAELVAWPATWCCAL